MELHKQQEKKIEQYYDFRTVRQEKVKVENIYITMSRKKLP